MNSHRTIFSFPLSSISIIVSVPLSALSPTTQNRLSPSPNPYSMRVVSLIQHGCLDFKHTVVICYFFGFVSSKMHQLIYQIYWENQNISILNSNWSVVVYIFFPINANQAFEIVNLVKFMIISHLVTTLLQVSSWILSSFKIEVSSFDDHKNTNTHL